MHCTCTPALESAELSVAVNTDGSACSDVTPVCSVAATADDVAETVKSTVMPPLWRSRRPLGAASVTAVMLTDELCTLSEAAMVLVNEAREVVSNVELVKPPSVAAAATV